MSVLSLICVLSLLPAVLCIRCHQVPNEKLTNPITSIATECTMNSNSCLKNVDVTAGLYSKQCGFNNCTSPAGITNQAAQCFNSSVFGRESYNCCCYGDGCNSASNMSITLIVLLSILALYTKLSQ